MKFLTRIAERISWHRRGIAALLAALAVLSVVAYLKQPPPDQVAVVVSTRAIPAGHRLTDADVRVIRAPSSHIPKQVLSTPSDATGRITAARLAENTAIQPGVLLDNRQPGDGRSIVPIVLRESSVKHMLKPGMVVTLVISGDESSGIITDQAVIAAGPAPDSSTPLTPTSGNAPVVLVDVPTTTARDVAVLGQQGTLAIILGGKTPT